MLRSTVVTPSSGACQPEVGRHSNGALAARSLRAVAAQRSIADSCQYSRPKHHVIAEGHGIPLALSLTGGNRNDVTQLMPLITAIPPVRGRHGRPRKRPACVYADRGYDHDVYRRRVWRAGIRPRIARRGTPLGSGLGVHRWVIERTIALLRWFRRLRIRWRSATTSTRRS